MNKLKSRKFWLCVAMLLSSFAAAVAGMTTDNPGITLAGLVCGAVSTAIYTICESALDAGREA